MQLSKAPQLELPILLGAFWQLSRREEIMTGTKHTLFGLLSCAVMAYAGRFSKFKTCETCVAAGYGWSTQAGKCGGFPNKVCATAAKPASQSPPPPPGCNWNGACGKHDYDTCQKCVGAGSGWCPLQRRCGGYASSMCPDDERSAMRTPEEQKEYAKEMGVVPDATPDELAATAKRQQENYRKLMAGETVEKPKPARRSLSQRCRPKTAPPTAACQSNATVAHAERQRLPSPALLCYAWYIVVARCYRLQATTVSAPRRPRRRAVMTRRKSQLSSLMVETSPTQGPM